MKLKLQAQDNPCEVPAALKAIRLIELMGREKRLISSIRRMGREKRPMRLTEIAENLKTNKTIVLRLLRVFKREGWGCRVGNKRSYRLSFRPLHYVATAIESNELVSCATPVGYQYPYHFSAPGKALLAYQP